MATGGGSEAIAQRILRITDIAQEPLEFLVPIGGYAKTRLVSLEKAVEPLVSILPDVQSHAYVAKQRCKKPADGLSQDESASIMLYTMGWKPLDECLYVVLNAVLRSADRQQKLERWYLYLRLFLNALFRLPPVRNTAYRGVKLDMSKSYIKGETIVWWGFSSCTTAVEVLQSNLFLGETGTRTMFNIQCETARDIRKHSYYSAENEVLLLAATQFQVICSLKQGDLRIVQLTETRPPHPLLQPVPIVIPTSDPSSTDTQWKQDGITIAGGNGRGNQLNQLSYSWGIFIDDNQTIYIADCGNNRIVEWKCNATNAQIFAGEHGKGNQTNQLNSPREVIIDKENNSLVIADFENSRVMRWSRQNNTKNGEIIIKDIGCWGLTMDKNGALYVSDYKKHEVRRWKRGDQNGTVIAGGNGKGNLLNQLNSPTFIFVDEDYSLYVSDSDNHRVMKWLKDAKEGIIVAGGNGRGNSLTQLSYPRGLIVDQLGRIYVADAGNHRVMRWCKGANEGTIVVGGNGRGEQSNQLYHPVGLSFDRQGNLYVVDFENNRIQKFEIN